MKKTISMLLILIAAAALVSCTFTVPAQEAPGIKEDIREETAETVEETVETTVEENDEETLLGSIAETLGDIGSLSPELLRDGILTPAISFHPGTAGTTLGSALAAAKILAFSTEHQLRLEDENETDQLMKDAYAMLSVEERGWLMENLPGLIDLTDSVFTDYDSLSGRFEDAGAGEMIQSVLANEHAAEDWARARKALAGLENYIPEE